MSNSFIRNFTSFQKKRNLDTNIESPITESVKVINDRFIIGGIELKQSMINSYIKKVKDATGQDLNNTFSKSEIAEQLIAYLVDKHGDVDNIPPAALLGGDEEMVDQVEEISMEDEDSIVDEEGMEEVADEFADVEEEVEETEEEVADVEEEIEDMKDMDLDLEETEEETEEEFQDIEDSEDEEEDEEDEEEDEEEGDDDVDLPL